PVACCLGQPRHLLPAGEGVQGMIRRVAIAAIAAVSLFAPLSAAAPASAGSGVGCTGNDCSVLLTKLITLNGDVGSGGFAPLSLPPPPCLWEPIGDAVSGSNYIISQFGTAAPGTPFGVAASVRQARRLLRTKPVPAGPWYLLPVNPAAGAAGAAECARLPLFFFAVPGQALPALPIPPRTLAEYAYNHMLIPRPALATNPAARGYVNLGTYVWGNWPPSPTTGRMSAYKGTAPPGGMTVTVVAQARAWAGTGQGRGPQCWGGWGRAGSPCRVGKPPATAGPGAPPDCGVLWQAPTAGAALTATVRWVVTWGVGNLDGPGN